MSPTSSYAKSRELELGDRRGGSAFVLGLLCGCAAFLQDVSVAQARDLWEDETGDRYITLNSSVKSVLLLGEEALPGQGPSGTNFWRGRLDLQMTPAPWMQSELAYEHRAVVTAGTNSLTGASAFLPPTGDLPYRVIPLGAPIVDDGGVLYEHSFDRMALAVRGDWGEVKIGRQAIGLGRASFFTALDLLSPFGTFQVDQEWKAGVDAINAELQVGNTSSLGLTVAAESEFEDAAVLGRYQAYFGDMDLVVVGGKRSEDWMGGVAASTQVFDAEFHGELAGFKTNGEGIDRAQLGDDGVLKAVAGGSYSFGVLGGLNFLSEYHFNGFGIAQVGDDASAFFDPAWIARLQRGDFQTLGQHEIAASLNLVVDENITTLAYVVLSPVDGSGLGAVGGSWSYSDHLSLDLNGFVPWGAGFETSPLGFPQARSEYGGSPVTVYMSLRFYD